jgi:5-methylcytosine-specific restriction endonuclease McrA
VQCAALKHEEWKETNPGRKSEIDKEYHDRPEVKARAYAKVVEKRAADPQARRDEEAARYAKNPVPYKARSARYVKKVPTAGRIRQHTRRGRKREAEGSHTLADMLEILAAQNYRCAYFEDCGVTLTVQTRVDDHIIALANGGTNWRRNMQCLCRSHNASKADKDPIVWVRKKLGWLI